MNEPIFNSVHHLIRRYTTATRQKWVPPDVTNCLVFNFKWVKLLVDTLPCSKLLVDTLPSVQDSSTRSVSYKCNNHHITPQELHWPWVETCIVVKVLWPSSVSLEVGQHLTDMHVIQMIIIFWMIPEVDGVVPLIRMSHYSRGGQVVLDRMSLFQR